MAFTAPEGSATGVKPEINVTPLVDVVLVLLIIFMVIAPQLDNAGVELPQAKHAERSKSKAAPVVVTVDASGTLFLERERTTAAALAGQLRQARTRDARRRVVLRADRRTPFAAVREVYKVCQEAGLAGIGLQADDRATSGSRQRREVAR